MRKLFTVISITFFFAATAFSQAVVDLPLSVSDGSATLELAVGLDLTATNCLDPTLGESDLPPFPPAGVFEFRFDLQPYCGEALSSYKDYRAPGDPPAFPYSDTVQHRIIWQRSAPGLPINIDYDLPVNYAAMVIQDEVGGIIMNLGPFEGTGTAIIPGTYPLSSAYIYMIYTDIIPVELTSFTATVYGQEVQLNWITATETNNRGFEIERCMEEKDWQKIGFVEGNGTTVKPQSYTFTDENVSEGVYKYRLQQIDFDGSFNYSNVVAVSVGHIPAEYKLFQNYPNPFNPSTMIRYQVPEKSNVTIKVYNLLGREINTLFSGPVQPGYHNVEWNGLNNHGVQMSTGIYIYTMTAGTFTGSGKMILMK